MSDRNLSETERAALPFAAIGHEANTSEANPILFNGAYATSQPPTPTQRLGEAVLKFSH
jgi:hypothetical protein